MREIWFFYTSVLLPNVPVAQQRRAQSAIKLVTDLRFSCAQAAFAGRAGVLAGNSIRTSRPSGTLVFWPSRESEWMPVPRCQGAGACANADGASGQCAFYMGQYYGAFVRDLDGHKIEAMFRDASAG